MKRFVNVRIPVILAIALIIGIMLSCLFSYYGISLFWITAIIPIIAVIIILCAVFSKNHLKIVFILLIALLFISGIVNGFVRLDNYGKSRLIDGGTYSITATVCEKGAYSDGEYVILNNARADNKKIDGKIIVYLGSTYGDYCDVGYKVSFNAQIARKDTFPYGKLNYYVQENVKYSCFVNGGLTVKYGYSFFGSIRSHLRDTLYKNFDNDMAAIAFAMLTGNTQGVDDGALASFRFGGIAHIFAVSGLHIGILYGIIYFFLKKFKLNKFALTALCILPLFFYAGICGFTLSSVRAVIMCTVSAIAQLAHKKYDSLNALSLAVIIILTVNPLSLFSVGFQLSVCAVGAIILLSKNISRPFKKLPKKISGAISVSLSAQAGTLPVMLVNFGYLSGAGLLLNIVIIPILSALYVVLFISAAIACIMPFTAAALPYLNLPLQFIISAFMNAGFEKALISGFGAGAFLPVYYIALLLISDKINLNLLYRLTAVSCTVIFLCSYVIIRTFAPLYGYNVIISAYYGGGEILIKSGEGKILIITEDISPSQTQSFLNEYYANNLSAVIILGGEECVMAYGQFDLNCKDVYVYFGYIDAQPYSNLTVNYENEFTVCGVNFTFADGYSLIADCGGVSIAVCAGDYVPFESCDLLVCDCFENNCESALIIGFNERNIKYNIYECGDFIYKVRNGLK